MMLDEQKSRDLTATKNILTGKFRAYFCFILAFSAVNK